MLSDLLLDILNNLQDRQALSCHPQKAAFTEDIRMIFRLGSSQDAAKFTCCTLMQQKRVCM